MEKLTKFASRTSLLKILLSFRKLSHGPKDRTTNNRTITKQRRNGHLNTVAQHRDNISRSIVAFLFFATVFCFGQRNNRARDGLPNASSHPRPSDFQLTPFTTSSIINKRFFRLGYDELVRFVINFFPSLPARTFLFVVSAVTGQCGRHSHYCSLIFI